MHSTTDLGPALALPTYDVVYTSAGPSKRKATPPALVVALTSIVFALSGGPWSSTPRRGLSPSTSNARRCVRGHSIILHSACLPPLVVPVTLSHLVSGGAKSNMLHRHNASMYSMAGFRFFTVIPGLQQPQPVEPPPCPRASLIQRLRPSGPAPTGQPLHSQCTHWQPLALPLHCQICVLIVIGPWRVCCRHVVCRPSMGQGVCPSEA
jgi:hypothetical protein